MYRRGKKEDFEYVKVEPKFIADIKNRGPRQYELIDKLQKQDEREDSDDSE